MGIDKKKLLLIGGGIGLGLLLLIILFIVVSHKPPAATEAKLTFWGTFDDASLYRDIIDSYEKQHPLVQITYRQIPFEDYERTLVSAFAAGNGPDIWLMHNTWLPKHLDKISPLPQTGKTPLFTFKQFQEQFVDVAVSDLTRNQQIYALPTYANTLQLYYNKDTFNTAGISAPPKTWEEFVRDVKILTARDDKNNITKSAAAIGTARNINRSTDLLSLLMLQSGVRMTSADNTQATFSRSVEGLNVGELALQFYTDFANQAKPDRYTWNDLQNYSIDAFSTGKTPMMFNYSHHIQTLRAKAPRLNFGVAPIPQPEKASVAVNFANYWAPTVSKQSKNPEAAWQFLVYLTAGDGAKAYLAAADRPAARRDLIETQRTDADLGTFAVGALTAHSWYQQDNVAIEEIFAKMIDDVNYNRASVKDALRNAESQVNVIMNRR